MSIISVASRQAVKDVRIVDIHFILIKALTMVLNLSSIEPQGFGERVSGVRRQEIFEQ